MFYKFHRFSHSDFPLQRNDKINKKSRMLTGSLWDSVSSVYNVVTLHRRPTIERAVESSRNHDRVLMTVARNSGRTKGGLS